MNGGRSKATRNSLAGVFVGLSVSADEETARLGFDEAIVNNVIRQLAESLVALDAGLVLGHDWRPGGVMHEVLRLAIDRRASQRSPEPTLRNVLPWPDQPAMAEDERAELAEFITIELGGLPPALESRAVPKPAKSSDAYRYLRARGLTWMREKLIEIQSACICMGGRTTGAQGRYPGVVEELLLAVKARRPIYVSRLFGGACAQVVDALRGETDSPPAEFAPTDGDVRRAYEAFAPRWEPDEPAAAIDGAGIWHALRKIGVRGIAARNGLTVAQNEALFDASSVDAVLHFVVRGLLRLRTTLRLRRTKG
ncbi:MAG: hypothetical protein HZB39_05580 [Planctomycetes bacterium]|nr:hypothetical protein [Planctomycetota bacterium]